MRALKFIMAFILLSFLTILLSFNAYATNSKDVNKQIRNAQSLFFKGKAQEADDALKKAEKMAAEIMTGKDDAEKNKIKKMDARINKLRNDIDKRFLRKYLTRSSIRQSGCKSITHHRGFI